MAIFCLATSLKDLKERLGNIVFGYTRDGKPLRARDLKAHGAMTVLLKDQLAPNLVQTLENNAAFIHGGPFANIAHGCNSVIATKTALKLVDYVVTEAGFGADLGAEKFLDIKCRKAGLMPAAAVIVATVRALKHHGGVGKEDLNKENLVALEKGLVNLERHVHNVKNVYNIPCASTGAQMGGWFRKEIHSLHDLKGLKIRVGGLAGQVLSRLGATPQVIPTSEVYPALERGTLDAAKLAAPHDDERAGLNRIARYYYMPGWAEGTTQLSMYINLDAWQALPPEYQAILEAACQRTNVETQARFDAVNPGAIQRMVNGGTQLRRFPDDMLHAAYREAHALYAEYADKHPRFRKVYDHWRRFRGRQIAWSGIAERPYDNFLAQQAQKS